MLVVFDIDGKVREQNLHDIYDFQFIKCRHLEEDIKFDFEDWGKMKTAKEEEDR